jgi:dienelactone hydrolase
MKRRLFLGAAAAAPLLGCNQEAAPVTSAADVAAPIPPGRSSRDVPLPLGAGGAPVRLRFLFQRPAGPGPYPLLVMHHGSTGRGNDPSLFGNTSFPTPLAEAFAAGGWLVAAPQRRGRGGSQGRYEEGLSPAGSGYSNLPVEANAGFARALADAQAATDWLLARPEVDAGRVVLAGQSRGGILALVQAAEAPPPGLKGTLNFVGGWLGGAFDPNNVNAELFRRAGSQARAPALFLYGERDPFYSIAFRRSNFATFEAAGGRGGFEAFELPAASGRNGHSVIWVPSVWGPSVARFTTELGLPAPALA